MKVAFLPTLGLLSFPTAISQGLLVTTVSIPYCPTPAASGLGTETYGGDGGFGANGTSVSYGSSEEGSPPSTTPGAGSLLDTPYGRYRFFGYYPVPQGGYILDGAKTQNVAMTLEFCTNFCRGSAFFAITNRDACSCSATRPAGAPVYSPSSPYACASNSGQSCGAPGYGIVYRLSPWDSGSYTPISTSTNVNGQLPIDSLASTSPVASQTSLPLAPSSGILSNIYSSTDILEYTHVTSSTSLLQSSPSSAKHPSSQSSSVTLPVLQSSILSISISGGSLSFSNLPGSSSVPIAEPSGSGSGDIGRPSTPILPTLSNFSSTSFSLTRGVGTSTTSRGSSNAPSPSSSVIGSPGSSASATPPNIANSPSLSVLSSIPRPSSTSGSPSTRRSSSIQTSPNPSSPAASAPPSNAIASSPSQPYISFMTSNTMTYHPIATPADCSRDNFAQETDPLSVPYNINCDRNLVGDTLQPLHADNIDSCLQACDMYSGCAGVSYLDGSADPPTNLNCQPYSLIRGYTSRPTQNNSYAAVAALGPNTGLLGENVSQDYDNNLCTDTEYGDQSSFLDTYGNSYFIRCGYGFGTSTGLAAMAADSLLACVSYCSLYNTCVGVYFQGSGPPARGQNNCFPVSARGGNQQNTELSYAYLQ